MIDDYAGFATSDGVLTLVPSFADASGHSCPGFLRMTIMARALSMELTHGFSEPDTYCCWRDFKSQVVECLTSEAEMGLQHFSRKGLHLPAPSPKQAPHITHRLNTGGFTQGSMVIPQHGSDAERHGLFAIDMSELLNSIRDAELGTFSHHQSLLYSNLSRISSKINDTHIMQAGLNTARDRKRLYLRTVKVTLTEDYCCHSGEVYFQKGGVGISCLAIVNVNSDMHGILPLTPEDEQNPPQGWSSPMEWDIFPGPIKRLISPVPVIHHYCVRSQLQSYGKRIYGIHSFPYDPSDEDWVHNCQSIVPNYNSHRTLLVPWAPMNLLVLQYFRGLASQAAAQARVDLIDETFEIDSRHYTARFRTNSPQSHYFLTDGGWKGYLLPIADLLKAHTIICHNGQRPSPIYCLAFKSFQHCRDLHAILVTLGIRVYGDVPSAKEAHDHRTTRITAPPPTSLVPFTVDRF